MSDEFVEGLDQILPKPITAPTFVIRYEGAEGNCPHDFHRYHVTVGTLSASCGGKAGQPIIDQARLIANTIMDLARGQK